MANEIGGLPGSLLSARNPRSLFFGASAGVTTCFSRMGVVSKLELDFVSAALLVSEVDEF